MTKVMTVDVTAGSARGVFDTLNVASADNTPLSSRRSHVCMCPGLSAPIWIVYDAVYSVFVGISKLLTRPLRYVAHGLPVIP